ncbi:hypothetical protein FBU59_001999 [Linderina macrospora]|uniref:Uncharacterized protein n=1 Tax=Linderina macrospora TaxID=4868 RepID=A0ACC1JCL3_9FUNG|nr:hypothetical protein FBU59_001999 [Linderina macrospora]
MSNVTISNKYGYIVTGTPTGISAFRTADAEDALVNGKPPSDDQPVELAKRNEISVGKVTHVALSADELSVIVALATGSIMVFPARELMEDSCSKTVRIISIHREIRDIRPNPLEMPMLVAVLTLGGAVLMVDIAQGTTKKITGDSNAKVTCICWSPRGKQIVCGDVDGMLTQRTPMDGVVQRVIHPAIGEKHPGSFAVLAVNWIKTYIFMAIYGKFPPGGFMAGHGGGGDGSTDDDDESGNIQTTAYVITQAGKQAPMHWRYIVDPCGAFEFPKRYPGFHFASINDWGKSAPHLQFLTSAGSAKVMTIAHCLPSMVEGERASGDVPDWCVLDTDPLYAQLPLAMVNTDESDTASLGMAIDFTSKRNLPPLSPEDSTEPVPPQPIMWILTTDGCLVGYYIYNTIEIEGGQQYAVCKHYPGLQLEQLLSLPLHQDRLQR